MHADNYICSPEGRSVFNIHALIRTTGVPNYMQARIPVPSQLNVSAWKNLLTNYWDQQLLQLIEFGFLFDFNRNCVLKHEEGNHSSATEFPNDIDAYIQEECKFKAILGPFKSNPIPGAHTSPFMTRHKPDFERRHVIIDLSWLLGASVNAGIDKQTYLGSEFDLTFPSVDDIPNELKCLGRGARLYKVDVSCAFRHVKVDPGDFNLLGLQWHGAYVDTCLPFGMRHGSQIFQRLRQEGFCIIDYIDDYVGVGVPGVAHKSFNHLVELMHQLGLTISEKKLVPPSTQVVCLGVLIDTERGSVSKPNDKLNQIWNLLSFLECLVSNQCSATMVANHVSAIKANLTLYHLEFGICDHPNVKYFTKSLRINRPLSVVYHNIIDIDMLKCISRLALTR